MRHAISLSLALMLGAAAVATEPVATEAAPRAGASAVSKTAGDPIPKTGPRILPRKRLDLRAGKIRDLMMPRDLEALMKAPDYEKDAVVVEGKRELLPMEFEEPIPAGFPPATLWWMLKNPSQSWRALLPDINRPDPGPLTMEQKVPQREFRWGP